MEDLLHKTHCAFIDNRYTSVEIWNIVKSSTNDVVGTLRQDCKRLPDSFAKKKLK